MLADQTNGPGPVEDKLTLCPTQITDREGVMAIVVGSVIETVATAVAVQDPVPDKTV